MVVTFAQMSIVDLAAKASDAAAPKASFAVSAEPPNASYWGSLKYFSYYRIIVAGLFLAIILVSDGTLGIGSQHPKLFRTVSLIYLVGAFACVGVMLRWQHAFNLQLTLQVIFDITCLSLFLFASGGTKSGISMMLLVVLSGAGLVGQGRMTLFYAALATLFVLLEQSYRVLQYQGDISDFLRTGLTSIGFFGSAIAARLLAQRVIANEDLARHRGVELADQMRINERVIRDMQDGVLVIDNKGLIRQSNPQAAALLGLSGTSPTLLSISAPELAREIFARRNRDGGAEFVFNAPQSRQALRARLLPPGDRGYSLIYLEDIGRMQEQARQAKLAALGRLTANMAHEIRNPLAAISHAAELLSDEAGDGTTGRLTRIIGDNTQRLNRLVAEVMELGRRDRAVRETVNLSDFLQHLKEEYSVQSEGCATCIEIDAPVGQTVCFDRGHLHRVMTNLIDNALRFASKSPSAVTVHCRLNAGLDRVEIHVIDDGPGIGEQECLQIFEPFFTTCSSGTGLGLYIARELSEANGARLSFLDNAPGAHFCLSCVPNCHQTATE